MLKNTVVLHMNQDTLHRVLTFIPSFVLYPLAASIENGNLRTLILSSTHILESKEDYLGETTKLVCDDKLPVDDMILSHKHIRYVKSNFIGYGKMRAVTHMNVTSCDFWVMDPKTKKHVLSSLVNRVYPNLEKVYFCHGNIFEVYYLFLKHHPKVHTVVADYITGYPTQRFPNVKTLIIDNKHNISKLLETFPNVENIFLRWSDHRYDHSKLVKNIAIEYCEGDSLRAENSILLFRSHAGYQVHNSVHETTKTFCELTRAVALGAKYIWCQAGIRIREVGDECRYLATCDIPIKGVNRVEHLILLSIQPLPTPFTSDRLKTIYVPCDGHGLERQLIEFKENGFLPSDVIIQRSPRAKFLSPAHDFGVAAQFPNIEKNWP